MGLFYIYIFICIVDKGQWLLVCKIAPQLDKCFAMHAKVKGCQLLLWTLNEKFTSNTVLR